MFIDGLHEEHKYTEKPEVGGDAGYGMRAGLNSEVLMLPAARTCSRMIMPESSDFRTFSLQRCHMHPTSCLNCETLLTADDNFCPNCGQKTSVHRFTIGSILHEFFHSITHVDKGILFLIKELLVRPGYVVREYIEGKRKKYFNPFTFLVLLIGIATIMLANTSYSDYVSRIRSNPVSNFFNKHANLIILFNVPVLSFFTWLLFKRKKLNYAEHLVFITFLSGERSVFFTLIVAPLMILFKEWYFILLGTYIFCWWIYLGWASGQLFSDRRPLIYLKAILAGLITQVITMAVISGSVWIYFKLFYH